MENILNKKSWSEKGAVIVESAIVIPFMLFITFSVWDLSQALIFRARLSQVASTGTRLLSRVERLDLEPSKHGVTQNDICIDGSGQACSLRTSQVHARIMRLLETIIPVGTQFEIKSLVTDYLDKPSTASCSGEQTVRVQVEAEVKHRFSKFLPAVFSVSAEGPYVGYDKGYVTGCDEKDPGDVG